MSVHSSKREQTTDQALRRLKYLHTSLTQNKSRQGGRLRKLWVNESPDPNDNANSSSTTNKHPVGTKCLLSLEPENGLKKKQISGTKNELKSKKNVRTGWKPGYHKRAPFVSPTAYFNPTYTAQSCHRPVDRPFNKSCTNSSVERRISKSAPVTPTLDPDQYECGECFAKDFEALNKQNSKEYYTNIRIGRVSFSARPSSQRRSTNSTSVCGPTKARDTRRKIPLPPKCCYAGGWGVRKPKDTRNIAEDLSLDSPLAVTAGLRTLKLHTQSKPQDTTYPPPPPTPIQQIDIKLPEGKIIKSWLVESIT